MGIKSAVKEWVQGVWKEKVQTPIANKTIELENSASQQWNTYSNKAKEQAYKPVDYYRKQEAFYRGLFWICILLLIVLWILSGS